MEFGFQFFPAVDVKTRTAEAYFDDALRLLELGEPLGYGHVRIVEHYFHGYGGYSPNPLLFLTAASQRTKTMRLITGAILPIFNHPLKLAGEIGMIDAISHGRVEIGFARAFLPHEFERFGISLDESRERFDEGLAQITDLLERENVVGTGKYHAFPATTSYPRPTQQPRPPFWIAALATDASFVNAGRLGHSVMAIPFLGAEMRRLIGLYRDAWCEAGHPGNGRVMLAFHMYCSEDEASIPRVTRAPLNFYLKSLVDAASDWTTGASSKDYAGYDKIMEKMKSETWETQMASGAAWFGTPAQLVKQINEYNELVGGFEVASLQVNFGDIPFETARRSMELFASAVMPQLGKTLVANAT